MPLTERVSQKELIAEKTGRDYALNFVRALKQKADQYFKDTNALDEKMADNRVFMMSGDICELYRYTRIVYFEHLMIDEDAAEPVKLNSVKDKQGMAVENQIKVQLKRYGGDVGHQMYTVNLYHTISSMMVNRREANLFTRHHKVALNSVMNILSYLDTINKELHAVLI